MFEVTLNTQGNEGSLKEGEPHPPLNLCMKIVKVEYNVGKENAFFLKRTKNLDTGLIFVSLSFRDKLRHRKMCVSVCV